MIDELNKILRDLIQSRIPALAGPTQVGFEPPNESWRTAVVAASEERLNIYLYDLRENLKLRTNARTRKPDNGWSVEERAEPRLDCHYLLTAWSPATFDVEPTRDEHGVLYEALKVLMQHRPLAATEVYSPRMVIPSSRDLNSVDFLLREEKLPLEVALPDGMRNQGDFWSTMDGIWRPALELTVTVPVFLPRSDNEWPMVTTVIGDYRASESPETAEVWLSVGGHVLVGDQRQAVQGAWVQVLGLEPPEIRVVDRRTITRADGRFLFSRLRPGRYRLRYIAPDRGDREREVDLPSETGEYDLRFP